MSPVRRFCCRPSPVSKDRHFASNVLRFERPVPNSYLGLFNCKWQGLSGMHMCDRCGETFDSTELNVNDKLVLDDSGQWKKETTYRCYSCIKQDAFG